MTTYPLMFCRLWLRLGAVCAALLAHAQHAHPSDEPTHYYLDGNVLPEDEGSAMNVITSWLDRWHWTPGWETGETAQTARSELERLVQSVPQAPWLALGLGQAFLLYFWWLKDGLDVDVDAGTVAAALHRASIQFTGCNGDLPPELFQHLQCAWRWKHVLMIPTEMGVHLARRRSHPAVASSLLREAATVWARMQEMPYFKRPEWPTPSSININADYFPGPVNRPVWPPRSLPIAEFLEDNAHVFRADLDAMIESGSFMPIYWAGDVSMTQFAPRHEGWAMLSLLRNGQFNARACAVANASCTLLASRPEISQCSAGDVGAAFARMMPGQGLRPHFWNAPRLGVHLGLVTPPGATFWVGGEAISWQEGKATIFDDTYTHAVMHEGTEPRYLLIAWFCHPCDRELSTVRPDRHHDFCHGG